MASEMREMFPTLTVDLMELDGVRTLPHGVVATPTYLLDGRVISLGNPRREDLVAMIIRLKVVQT